MTGCRALEPLCVARSPRQELLLLPAIANRHGLVAGAASTGKAVTPCVLAEGVQPDRRVGLPIALMDPDPGM